MKFNQTFNVGSPLLSLGNFYFNGTGVSLTGNAGEPSNLSYSVILDNNTYTYADYQVTGALFDRDDLSNTVLHRVALYPSDILGTVVVEMDVDADMLVNIDDADLWGSPPAGTSFQTNGAWAANACIGSGQYDATCHTSSTAGDSMTFTFDGDAVTVYGALDNANSRYTVTIDGGAQTGYEGVVASVDGSVALASASNLGPGSHTVTITNNAGKVEIDYVTIWTTASPTSGAHTSSAISKGARTGLIVGTVLGCFFLALLWMVYLLYRERTDAVKAAAAKILNSDVWSFDWLKKEHDSDSSSSSDGESFTNEKRPISPITVTLPVVSHPAPTHSKTTSFDAPWLESSPGPRQASFHPFAEDVEVPPTNNRFAFLNRSWWGH